MGCDIHWMLEARQPDGRWRCLAVNYLLHPTDPETGEDVEPTPEQKKMLEGISEIRPYADRGEDNPHPLAGLGQRNYWLFWKLAGVRSGPGEPVKHGADSFAEAGVTDVSDYAKAEEETWDVDGHSFVVYTLAELEQHFGKRGSDVRVAVVMTEEENYLGDLRSWMDHVREICDADYGGDATALRLLALFDN